MLQNLGTKPHSHAHMLLHVLTLNCWDMCKTWLGLSLVMFYSEHMVVHVLLFHP